MLICVELRGCIKPRAGWANFGVLALVSSALINPIRDGSDRWKVPVLIGETGEFNDS
jgi:hypothetical protein